MAEVRYIEERFNLVLDKVPISPLENSSDRLTVIFTLM